MCAEHVNGTFQQLIEAVGSNANILCRQFEVPRLPAGLQMNTEHY